MQHSFDIEVAEKYGIEEAILLNHIYFWVEKNRANNTNLNDGRYWTYNSVSALNELFPYLTQRKISYALKHLVEKELITTGNFNNSAYDRTLWYTLTDKGYSILQNKYFHFTNLSNGTDENVEPIPYIIPYIETDNNNEQESEDELKQHFEDIWEEYPNKKGKAKAFKHYFTWLKGKPYCGKTVRLTARQMWYAVQNYLKEIEKEHIDPKYIKHGDTFFNNIADYVYEEDES